MNYFKDTKNNIFAYDDEQVRQGYSKDLTPINATQVQSFKLFGVWDKTQAEIDTKFAELKAQSQLKAQQKAFNDAILEYLDAQCNALGFTGDDKTRPYRAVANYVGYDNVFREEAEKLGSWIALTFQTAEQIEADVENGNRDMPTVDEVLVELPAYGG